MKILFLAFVLCFQAVSIAQPATELAGKVNDIYLNSFNNESIKPDNIREIQSVLNRIAASDSILSVLQLDKKNISDLINEFSLFENANQHTDSTLKTFYPVYLHFVSAFRQYYKGQFIYSARKKILFFTSSVSCECTVTMCQQQLAAVLRFIQQHNGQYELILEDTWSSSYFKDKFKAGFVPTVIVVDEQNKEIKRFVREDNFNVQ